MLTVVLRLPIDVLTPDLLTLARARKQFDAAAESEALPASVLRSLAHFRRILTPRPFFLTPHDWEAMV
jgi:hypothetical protein